MRVRTGQSAPEIIMGETVSPSFLRVAHDATDLNRQASAWLEKRVAFEGVRTAFLPAGRTPEALYKLWETEQPSWLRGLRLKQIDDVLSGPKAGVFRAFFEEHLPSFLSQMDWIDRADESADVAILGLGLNGHIAFHEPHLPQNFYGGCVDLSEITRRTLELNEQTWGITYGSKTFMNCRSILMIASGASKRDVVQKLVASSTTLPATSLLKHRDFTLLVDRDASN
jgi:6-phosphogluconolactonase/glucosamine-6-phosphate isomerase/deaminase